MGNISTKPLLSLKLETNVDRLRRQISFFVVVPRVGKIPRLYLEFTYKYQQCAIRIMIVLLANSKLPNLIDISQLSSTLNSLPRYHFNDISYLMEIRLVLKSLSRSWKERDTEFIWKTFKCMYAEFSRRKATKLIIHTQKLTEHWVISVCKQLSLIAV